MYTFPVVGNAQQLPRYFISLWSKYFPEHFVPKYLLFPSEWETTNGFQLWAVVNTVMAL